MAEQEKRHLSRINSIHVWTVMLKLLEEQGYIDPEGFLTPLGEEYVGAIEPEAESYDVALPDNHASLNIQVDDSDLADELSEMCRAAQDELAGQGITLHWQISSPTSFEQSL